MERKKFWKVDDEEKKKVGDGEERKREERLGQPLERERKKIMKIFVSKTK
jgi:hypothetical protein